MPEFNFKDKAPPCPPHIKDIYFLTQKERQQMKIWKERSKDEDLSEDERKKLRNQEKNEALIHFFNSDHSLAPPQHVTT